MSWNNVTASINMWYQFVQFRTEVNSLGPYDVLGVVCISEWD